MWTVYTTFDLSYNRQVTPAPFILGSTITQRQQAGELVLPSNVRLSHMGCVAGYFTLATAGSAGNGTNNNTFTYIDSGGNTYYRDVDAAYNVIIHDQQGGSLAAGAYSPPTPYTTNSNPLDVPAPRLPGDKQLKIVK